MTDETTRNNPNGTRTCRTCERGMRVTHRIERRLANLQAWLDSIEPDMNRLRLMQYRARTRQRKAQGINLMLAAVAIKEVQDGNQA